MCRITYTDFYLHPELKNKQSTLPRCPTTSVHLTHRATTPLCVRCRSQTTTFDGLESTPLVLLARTGTPRVQRHVRLCSQPWQSQCQYQYDTKTQCDIQTHTAWHTDTHIVWHTDTHSVTYRPPVWEVHASALCALSWCELLRPECTAYDPRQQQHASAPLPATPVPYINTANL